MQYTEYETGTRIEFFEDYQRYVLVQGEIPRKFTLGQHEFYDDCNRPRAWEIM